MNSPPKFITDLLLQRGISCQQEIEAFLYPKLADLPEPEKLLNAFAAAELIEFYLKHKLQIVIWGDYDVDGTTSTAMLVLFFRQLQTQILWHIPDRLTDGYGLNTEWFEQNHSRFCSRKFLLITVDNGISSHKEIEIIQKMGGDVIVTDHHAIPREGPPKCIVVNPAQKSCGFHKEKIAGVGVAFYLAAAVRSLLIKKNSYPDAKNINLKSFLAFVALGTVADLVEMTATNRILIRGGLEELECPRFVGIAALLEGAGIFGNVSSEDIGFLIGPRLNAAGRLGNSLLAVEVLISENSKIAKEKAESLNQLNDKRKRQTLADLDLAQSKISEYQVAKEKVCIVFGEFHPGVAGIVASKLVEIYGVPALVLSRVSGKGERLYTGSGRSVKEVNLINIIQQCDQFLEKYGGHAMAAGLTVKEQNIEQFAAQLGRKIRNVLEKKDKERRADTLQPDSYDLGCAIDSVMSREGLQYFSLLEPFGPGNPQPKFYDDNAVVVDARTVGRQAEHLTLMLRGRYSRYKSPIFTFS